MIIINNKRFIKFVAEWKRISSGNSGYLQNTYYSQTTYIITR